MIDKNHILKLRKATMLGIAKCREALVQANGNYEKAVEILRKEGKKIANKRAHVSMSQGRIFAGVDTDKKKGVLLMLSSETDFAANSEQFKKIGKTLLEIAIAHGVQNKEALLDLPFEGQPLKETLTLLSGQLRENISLKEYSLLEGPYIGFYVHTGSKLAAMTSLNKADASEKDLAEVAKNVAMQIVVSDPVAVHEKDIPKDILAKEEEIIRAYRSEKSPAHILEKAVEADVKKFAKENSLLHQPFIKDEKKTIATLLREVDVDLAVLAFQRMQAC